jgi:tripartite-type tricarboxylate transporter receptor subunit TctC
MAEHEHGRPPHDHQGASRRRFLRIAAATAALPLLPGVAVAQSYPTRTVRIIVAVSPGGTTDILARLAAQWLTTRLGQGFVVENRPGGGTNIGTEMAVRSPADGYTLFMANTANTISTSLYKNLSFNFANDLAPIAIMAHTPLFMLVHPSVPAKTVPEFIAYAKANPGKVNMGSGGKGSTGHVSGELFQLMAGLKLQHVPYRGEALAMTDLIGGQVQLVFATIGSSLQYTRAGQMRALAITTPARSNAAPEVPPLSDYIPGYESSSWSGLTAPKNTPTEIIELLNKEINLAAADPTIKARITDLGAPPVMASPAAFGKIIRDDTAKWAKVVAFSGASAD